MIADAFDTPIHLLDEAEITARGVALLLRQRLDGRALDADRPRVSQILRPKVAERQRVASAARDDSRSSIAGSMT